MNTTKVPGISVIRDAGLLCLGALIASGVWWMVCKAPPSIDPAVPEPLASIPARPEIQVPRPLPTQQTPVTIPRPEAEVAQTSAAAASGFCVQPHLGQQVPTQHDVTLDALNDDALRALAKQGNVDAMLTLAERLMDPARSVTGQWETFRLLEEAIAYGSTDAAMAWGENMLKNRIQKDPEVGEQELYFTRQLAAAQYVTALLMGDLRALEGVQAVLPPNPNRGYVVGMLRGGYIGYQKMLERRAELGLPPFAAHIPPYNWPPELRAIEDIMRGP